jgi:HlyD family secretion protein
VAEQNPLFRKAALDKLASPERLDVLVRVTSPKGWLALVTMAGVLAAVIVWSVIGSIPERIDGKGILIQGGELREVRATGDGVLTQLNIHSNDIITLNQVVGQIEARNIEEAVRAANVKYQDAMREFEMARAEDQATQMGTRANISGQQAEIARVQGELEKARDDLAAKREALAKGLVTKTRVQQVERDVLSLESTLTSLRAQITNLGSSITSVDQRIRARYMAVEAAKLEVERLTKSASTVSQIVATVEGRVVEMKKSQGDHIGVNDVVAVVEPPGASLEPVVYVDSNSGKRIKPGMEAQISPSNVKREEYGFMKGSVRIVGEYPVTPEGVMLTIKNQSLVQELIGTDAKIEMRAAITMDPKTMSGFQWSSSNGPPFKVTGGTRVVVSVVVDRRAPISYVLPILRGTLGAS